MDTDSGSGGSAEWMSFRLCDFFSGGGLKGNHSLSVDAFPTFYLILK